MGVPKNHRLLTAENTVSQISFSKATIGMPKINGSFQPKSRPICSLGSITSVTSSSGKDWFGVERNNLRLRRHTAFGLCLVVEILVSCATLEIKKRDHLS